MNTLASRHFKCLNAFWKLMLNIVKQIRTIIYTAAKMFLVGGYERPVWSDVKEWGPEGWGAPIIRQFCGSNHISGVASGQMGRVPPRRKGGAPEWGKHLKLPPPAECLDPPLIEVERIEASFVSFFSPINHHVCLFSRALFGSWLNRGIYLLIYL